MARIAYMVFVAILAFMNDVHAQERRNMPLPGDADIINRSEEPFAVPESERIRRFYDSLGSRSSRSDISNFIYRSLFRRPRIDTTEVGRIVDEIVDYKQFANMRIGNIYIQRDGIYDADSRGLPRYANNVHVLTRDNVIRRDLLFDTGDAFDPSQIVRTKQLLLSRDYLSEVEIFVLPQDDDYSTVDILVWTRDRWTISIDGSWQSRDRTTVELYDANILGTGNRLGIQTSFDRRKWTYQGNRIMYDIPNIMGTFYRGDFDWGRNFYDRTFEVGVRKDFMRPTDYEIGASYRNNKMEYRAIYKGSYDSVKVKGLDLWAGKSFYIKPVNSSIYFTGRYSYGEFPFRPETGPLLNPAFHDYRQLLVGLGLYNERFYSANMIYGYGYREYLAAGYKVELVGGYNDGEFRGDYYLGLNYQAGGFTGIGYLAGEAAVGSYVGRKGGGWWQSAADVNLRWISNLYRFRRSNIRQFLSLSHTRGWNRGEGNDEVITFTRINGPATLVDEFLIGRNRTVLNTETVVFTPYQPFGFRMAIFGFCDFALLGNNANTFKNDFFSTIGFGIRMKNERLVFNTIQIRVGLALGKGGLLHNQYLRVTSERRMQEYRFIPTYPQTVQFK